MIGGVFGVHVHDFCGGNDIERKRENEFADVGESAENKSIGRGFDGTGA